MEQNCVIDAVWQSSNNEYYSAQFVEERGLPQIAKICQVIDIQKVYNSP